MWSMSFRGIGILSKQRELLMLIDILHICFWQMPPDLRHKAGFYWERSYNQLWFSREQCLYHTRTNEYSPVRYTQIPLLGCGCRVSDLSRSLEMSGARKPLRALALLWEDSGMQTLSRHRYQLRLPILFNLFQFVQIKPLLQGQWLESWPALALLLAKLWWSLERGKASQAKS